jgi:hypothetical protein
MEGVRGSIPLPPTSFSLAERVKTDPAEGWAKACRRFTSYDRQASLHCFAAMAGNNAKSQYCPAIRSPDPQASFTRGIPQRSKQRNM